MFALDPFSILKDFKNYSWMIILLAVLLIIPYIIFVGPFKAYRVSKAQKQSESEAQDEAKNQAVSNLNAQVDWDKLAQEVDDERNK